MLNAKQKKLIPLIIEIGNIDLACKKADVGRVTYYNWLKIGEFKEELKKQQDAVYSNSIIKIKNLFDKAVDTQGELLDSEDESIKFRASQAIIDNTVKLIEQRELNDRIEAIESSLDEKSAEKD